MTSTTKVGTLNNKTKNAFEHCLKNCVLQFAFVFQAASDCNRGDVCKSCVLCVCLQRAWRVNYLYLWAKLVLKNGQSHWFYLCFLDGARVRLRWCPCTFCVFCAFLVGFKGKWFFLWVKLFLKIWLKSWELLMFLKRFRNAIFSWWLNK